MNIILFILDNFSDSLFKFNLELKCRKILNNKKDYT